MLNESTGSNYNIAITKCMQAGACYYAHTISNKIELYFNKYGCNMN